MKFKADLHVHSVLSGCADKENSVPNHSKFIRTSGNGDIGAVRS